MSRSGAQLRNAGWWQQIDLADSYRTLIGLEQAAVAINEYCSSVIPGLLQTREYARAVSRGGDPDVKPERVDVAADVRLRRQEILSRPRPPRLWAVLDEAALARVNGGPAVMREQLEHLLSAAQHSGITVQVIGFEYGTHPGGESHFILLEMGDQLPDVVYMEGLPAPRDSSLQGDLARYRRIWYILRAIALNPRDSADRIKHYIDKLPK